MGFRAGEGDWSSELDGRSIRPDASPNEHACGPRGPLPIIPLKLAILHIPRSFAPGQTYGCQLSLSFPFVR